jgi:hypothetical protein
MLLADLKNAPVFRRTFAAEIHRARTVLGGGGLLFAGGR